MQQYIQGYISDDQLQNASNLRKMQPLFKDVVNNLKFCRKILIPINNIGHWHLMEVNFETQEFRDYNSLCDYIKDDEVARWVRYKKYTYYNFISEIW